MKKAKRKRLSEKKEVFQRGLALILGVALMTGSILSAIMPVNAYAYAVENGASNGDSMLKVSSAETEAPEVSKKNALEMEPTQAAQTDKFNMSVEQPARVGINGKELDKKKGPMGTDVSVMNKIYQLAVSVNDGPAGTTNNNRTWVYDSAVSRYTSELSGKIISGRQPNTISEWAAKKKKLVGADLDGNAKEELVSAGIVAISANKYNLELYVTDYNKMINEHGQMAPSVSPKMVVKSDVSGFDLNSIDDFKIVSGDFDCDDRDEVAISLGNTLYLCKVTMNKVTVASAVSISAVGIIDDLKSLDSDKDGYKEILLTHTKPNKETELYIYNDLDGNRPFQIIPLSSNGEYIQQPCVDMGDTFGENSSGIIIAGTLLNKEKGNEKKKPEDQKRDTVLTDLRYDLATEVYEAEFERIFTLSSNETDFRAVKNHLSLKCVTLDTPIPGKPSASVVISGFVFKYNPEKAAFEKRIVDDAKNDSGKTRNIASTSMSNITNVNWKNDQVEIYDVLTGNFDGNTNGKEQIIILHKSKWYQSDYVYISVCQIDTNGKMITYANQKWKKDGKTQPGFPAIAAPYIYEKGLKFELMRDKSMFIFSNPSIVAVLGATPYYSELESKYGSLGNVATTYGKGTTTGSSKSNGIETKVSTSFGAMFEFDFIGIHNSQEVKTTVESSFTANWEKSRSVTKSYTINNGYSDDAVALMVVPYDIYYYKVSSLDPKTNKMKENIIRMEVPYAPQFTVMSVTDYNERAKSVKNMPQITEDVLKHTPGDPRTYQKNISAYGDPKSVLSYGTGGNDSFMGCGTGNVYNGQSIEMEEGRRTSYDYGLSVELSFNFEFEIITWGGAASVGYRRNATVFSSEKTLRQGQVAGVPSGYSAYEFSWLLVAYNYKLDKQSFPVINYLVKMNGEFPPKPPKSLIATGTKSGVALAWEQQNGPSGPSGYMVMRATSPNSSFETIATLPSSTIKYNDEKVELGKTYYYKVIAFNAKKSEPSETVNSSTTILKEMRVLSQPILNYVEGGKLDLGNLAVRLVYSDSQNQDVLFKDFGINGISVNVADGTILTTENSGTAPVISKGNITTATSKLSVEAKDLYDYGAVTTFKVGGNVKATELVAGQRLETNITIKSRISSTQDLIFILALYSDKGNMVQYATTTKAIKGLGSENVTLGLTLPANVKGYNVKVLIWDGNSLDSTKLNMKAKSASFPSM